MYAYLIAANVRGQGLVQIPDESLIRPEPSREAKELYERILAGDTEVSRGGKLRMLDPQSRMVIIDDLVGQAEKRVVTESLMGFSASELLGENERQVIVDRTTRRVTMFGNAYAKASLLSRVRPEMFAAVPDDIRAAFFEDVIVAIQEDQFDVVNEIVPALASHVEAVPQECHARFVEALMKQSSSNSYQGAPAARRILQTLPEPLATAGVNTLNVQYLLWYGSRPETREFVDRNIGLAGPELQPLLQDYLKMSRLEFLKRYDPDEV
jgi:hypothetical protein